MAKVDACLQLLRSPTDEEKFAGLLLVTRVFERSDGASLARVLDAVDVTFLARLLRHPTDHHAAYRTVALNIVSALCCVGGSGSGGGRGGGGDDALRDRCTAALLPHIVHAVREARPQPLPVAQHRALWGDFVATADAMARGPGGAALLRQHGVWCDLARLLIATVAADEDGAAGGSEGAYAAGVAVGAAAAAVAAAGGNAQGPDNAGATAQKRNAMKAAFVEAAANGAGATKPGATAKAAAALDGAAATAAAAAAARNAALPAAAPILPPHQETTEGEEEANDAGEGQEGQEGGNPLAHLRSAAASLLSRLLDRGAPAATPAAAAAASATATREVAAAAMPPPSTGAVGEALVQLYCAAGEQEDAGEQEERRAGAARSDSDSEWAALELLLAWLLGWCGEGGLSGLTPAQCAALRRRAFSQLSGRRFLSLGPARREQLLMAIALLVDRAAGVWLLDAAEMRASRRAADAGAGAAAGSDGGAATAGGAGGARPGDGSLVVLLTRLIYVESKLVLDALAPALLGDEPAASSSSTTAAAAQERAVRLVPPLLAGVEALLRCLISALDDDDDDDDGADGGDQASAAAAAGAALWRAAPGAVLLQLRESLQDVFGVLVQFLEAAMETATTARGTAVARTVQVLAAHIVPLLATWLPEESDVFRDRVRPLLPFLLGLGLPRNATDGLEACLS